ncbi:MAG: ADOP family duplicated permease, partial [Thermoanaerobaculia bacterium]
MRDIVRQLSTAFRSLFRQPAVMLPAVLTLALGIGANTALFAYLAAILWPTIDAPDPERIVSVYVGTEEEPRRTHSYPEYQDFLKGQTAVVDLVATSRFGASVSHGERTSYAWCALVTGNYFGFFNTRPTMGRLLQPADDRADAPPVVVVSHRFWQGTLGGSPDVVGRELRVNGMGMTVVGVAAEGFQGFNLASAIYVPASLTDRATAVPRLHERDAQWLNFTGRLAPGVTREKARAALDVLGRQFDASAPLPEGKPRKMDVVMYSEYDPAWGYPEMLDRARMLMGVASAFLLLACVSIANLLLARAISKQREWGIRASLGASRAWLLSGVLAESLVLCLMGGVLGLGVAAVLGRRIESYMLTAQIGLGDWAEGTRLLQVDGRIAAFAALMTVLCALLGALGPALRVMRGDLLGPLKSDASASGLGGMGLAPRKVLVVAQVALSVLLLLTGGLLVRTLAQARAVDPGFDPDGLLLVTVNVPRNVMTGKDSGAAIYQRVLDAARSTPGVDVASLAHILPVTVFAKTLEAASLDRQDEPVEVATNTVSPGYFQTLGAPILAGRALDERDREDAPRAVVVSRGFARKLWGEQPAVGRLLRLVDSSDPKVAERPFEVVGVAQDVRSKPMTEPEPMIYLSHEQRRHPRMTLLVRSASPMAALAPELRRALREAHPDLAVVSLASCREHMAHGLTEQRMYAEVAGLFALLGLGVAVVGLFGLLSYSVSLRGRELSIRMAIGARPRDVQRLVLR